MGTGAERQRLYMDGLKAKAAEADVLRERVRVLEAGGGADAAEQLARARGALLEALEALHLNAKPLAMKLRAILKKGLE